jgi:phosphoglycerate dehydrogenase-like enzyme
MKILFTSMNFAPGLPWEKISHFLPGHQVATCKRDQLLDSLDGVDVVVPLGTPIPRAVIEKGRFGLIQQFGVGVEKVDIEAADELGVLVARIPGQLTANAASVAELAIMFMLTLSRRLPEARTCFDNRNWARPLGSLMQGKTVCIVGVGAIGTAVATRLEGFDVKLVGIRQNKSKGSPSGTKFDTICDFSEMKAALSESDIVLLSVMYDASTHHLFDRDAIAAMKQGSFLVNVARGGLIDQDALLDALKSGHLGGAGLDVFWEEPVDPDHPLFALPNVIVTPHVGGLTDAHFYTGSKALADNILRYASGEQPLYTVNEPKHLRHKLLAK